MRESERERERATEREREREVRKTRNMCGCAYGWVRLWVYRCASPCGRERERVSGSKREIECVYSCVCLHTHELGSLRKREREEKDGVVFNFHDRLSKQNGNIGIFVKSRVHTSQPFLGFKWIFHAMTIFLPKTLDSSFMMKIPYLTFKFTKIISPGSLGKCLPTKADDLGSIPGDNSYFLLLLSHGRILLGFQAFSRTKTFPNIELQVPNLFQN